MARASVTIMDVAREAGVSKSAAARVLSRSGSASKTTRVRVLEAAEALGYRPNQLARAMKSGTTNTIGIVIPDVTIPFFSAVLRGVADKARASGFEVLVSNTDNDPDIEARSLELLAGQQVDGIVIAPVFQPDSTAILRLTEDGIPIVLLDRRMPGLEHLPLISVDHVAATESATSALAELGHDRIGLLAEPTHSLSELWALRGEDSSDPQVSFLRPSAQRIIGYFRALERHGIGVDDDLVLHSEYAAESAQAAVYQFLGTGTGATALHATNAVLSSGAYRGLRSYGLSIPQDFSFIGFDDQEWTTMVQPEVSVVEQPRQQLGEDAATMLLSSISNKHLDPVERFLQPQLLMRHSAAAPSRPESPSFANRSR